jgi:hypothetical protein
MYKSPLHRSINPTSFDQGWSKLDQCPKENVDIANQAVNTAVGVSTRNDTIGWLAGWLTDWLTGGWLAGWAMGRRIN